LQAGADYLLFRFDESAQREGHRLITDAVRSGSLSGERLDQSVRRIVDAKRRFGILDARRDQSAPDLAANARTALELARGATTLLHKLTTTFFILFVITSMALAVLQGRPRSSVMNSRTAAPTAPAKK